MATRPLLAVPLRSAVRQAATQPTRTQCFHSLRRPHPTPSYCLRQPCFFQQPRRSAGTFTGNARQLFSRNPLQVSLATVAILAGIAALGYTNYLYQTYILKAFHNYPEEVAKKLRRALYYTNTDLQPQEAIKYYRQALQVAEDLSMDPFSDEIMGVKIQVAKLMEDINQVAKAIQVLEILRRDGLEFIRLYGDRRHNKQKRTRVLAKCVAVSVKLGELYGTPDIFDREMAEERLVWAVETVLKESQRRVNIRQSSSLSEEQLQEQEGNWMSNSEIGAALEALATTYESKDQHYLATPLFLQALSLQPTNDCHSVILMNNLASSLAQQSPRAASAAQAYASSRNIKSSDAAIATGPVATRETMISNAQTWAQKALDVAAGIRPPERNEECDMGCAVATHNLGEFAEMLGNKIEARKRYNEAISVGKAVGFQEAVANSTERLRQLKT
ncbi:hypothetical protein B0A50_02472 [Salinomyces thailandicus]|uniref:TPR domain-containing protein n=1 Tax=Salinomyces thailandicus TaxID=706561 RepID=A0A4U0U7Y3_9PEZI|nr:hypothetical protein B0A50_02472 [Salinomyces thailandica]